MPTLEDTRLIQQCLQGKAEAQKMLYQKYVQAMYHTVIRMVVSKMDAEDVLQEAFVQVFQKLHTFKAESTLGAWIKKIVINASLMHLRKQQRMRFEALNTQQEQVVLERQDEPAYDMAQIHYAIKQLPDGCRVVLNLYLLEGYQHQEIAEILGISVSTSKSQYHRAKRMLRKKLQLSQNVASKTRSGKFRSRGH